MPHVFISYARKDGAELARRLYKSFNALEGWSAWMDTAIIASRSFTSEIDREIKRSDVVIVVLSPDVERPDSFVRKEIAFAQILDKPILPVRTSVVVPPVSIADLTWVDCFGEDYEECFDKLLKNARQAIGTISSTSFFKPTSFPSSNSFLLKLTTTLKRADSRLDFEWVEVPRGRFKMGGDPRAANAWPGGEFELDYTFWIAKFPVTYAQYEPFVEAGGYTERRYWTEAGWVWKETERVHEPLAWNDLEWYRPNRPVIGVSWYEAYAYTRWLNEALTPGPSPSGRGERGGEKFREMARQVMTQIARDLRKRQTDAERVLWECLRDRRLGGVKFRRQHPVAKTSYVVDFFSYEGRLIVEVDGPIHKGQREADLERQRRLEQLGYRVLRFTNAQIFNDLEAVLSSILLSLNSPLPQGEGVGVRAFAGQGRSASEKYVFRLLRECEWEKAARYPDGRLWPWGNDWDDGKRVNWKGTGLKRPSAVGEFPEGTHTVLGIQDLVGNVWEWCLTRWSERYYTPSVEDNCPEGGGMRCARGGSWSVIEVLLRPAGRSGSKANDRFVDWGFRLGIAPSL